MVNNMISHKNNYLSNDILEVILFVNNGIFKYSQNIRTKFKDYIYKN